MLRSLLKHFGGRWSKNIQMVYGVEDAMGNEEPILKRYRKHNQEVISYFSDRPRYFLIIDWGKNGWHELCTFLGRKVPRKRYNGKLVFLPHMNKAKKKKFSGSSV